MNIPCPQKIDCPDTEFPLSNYSSEAPDPPIIFRVPSGGGIVNFVGGGAGGPTRAPDGGPTSSPASYSSSRGCVGQLYQDLFNFGGVEPISFQVTSGSIPSWMSATVSGKTLHVSGTPNDFDTGSSAFEVTATDAIGENETRQYNVNILGLTSGVLLPQFSINTPYSTQLVAGGGSGGYTFGILSGSLPAGMTLSNDGLISGVPIVDSGAFPITLTVRDQSGFVCTQNIQFAFNSACNPAIAPVLDTTYALSGEAIIYVDVTDRIWLLNTGANLVQVIVPSTGAVESSFSVAVGSSVDSMAYDSVRHRVYIVYVSAGPTDTRTLILNAQTHAVVNDIQLSAAPISGGGDMKFDPVMSRMWIVQGGTGDGAWVVDCNTFGVATLSIPANFLSLTSVGVGGGFAVVSGNLNLGGGTFHVGIWELNSNTLATIGVMDIAPTNDSVGGIAYSPQSGRFYAAVTSYGFYSINAGLGTWEVAPVAGTDQSGVQYHPCRQDVVGFNGFGGLDPLVAYYISGSSTITNTVHAFVAPSQFPPPCTNSCFDTIRERMWFASGTTVCIFT